MLGARHTAEGASGPRWLGREREMKTSGRLGVEQKLMCKVTKIAKVINREGNEGEGVSIDGCTARLRDGELALGCCMVNGMSQLNGMVLNVQFTRVRMPAGYAMVCCCRLGSGWNSDIDA